MIYANKLFCGKQSITVFVIFWVGGGNLKKLKEINKNKKREKLLSIKHILKRAEWSKKT